MMKYFGYIIADRIKYIYIFKNKNSARWGRYSVTPIYESTKQSHRPTRVGSFSIYFFIMLQLINSLIPPMLDMDQAEF